MVKRESLGVELARKDRYPDFSVQYMWQRTGPGFPSYYMLTLSVRIPIYRRRKLDPELAQATEKLNRSRREYESEVQNAHFQVRDQYIAAQTASGVLKIYHNGLLPQSLSSTRRGWRLTRRAGRISKRCCRRSSMCSLLTKSTGKHSQNTRRPSRVSNS